MGKENYMKTTKRFLSFAVACIVICTSFITAFANNNIHYGPSEIVDFDEIETTKKGDKYIEAGKALRQSRATTSKYLTISKYYQKGQTWSGDTMYTRGVSIGDAGCGVCSLAMIFRNSNIFQDPGQLNSKIGDAACPLKYNAAGRPYLMAVYANKEILNGQNDEAVSYILGSISDNKPVLVYMTDGTYTHYVAAYGYTSANVIAINDPEPNWNYTTLNTYLDKGWQITRVVTYLKTN